VFRITIIVKARDEDLVDIVVEANENASLPCEIGDVATLIGADGDDQLSVADVAASASLSPYEILTGLRSRLPRRYVNDAGAPAGDE